MQSVYYNNLGANKRIYDAALQCFQNRGRSFPVTGSIQAAELAIEVLNDHPEIFYVGQEFRVMSSLMRRDIMPAYLYSPAEATKIRGQLDAAAQSIISEHINDHQSDYDKVRSLHDYLKSNLEYDTVAASSHRPNERNIAEAHNIIGALLKHKCVCEGFANKYFSVQDASRIFLEFNSNYTSDIFKLIDKTAVDIEQYFQTLLRSYLESSVSPNRMD